jgi:alpha-methylacyl-CoA racemase
MTDIAPTTAGAAQDSEQASTYAASDARLPLAGVRVLDLGGIGPGPFATMMLADMGAEVIRLERAPRPGAKGNRANPVLDRGKKSLTIDLKHPRAAQLLMHLGQETDIVIEGFRPGVAERLGLGPADFQAVNPALVYGRMTGFGQDGPLSQAAGHDMNYIASSGVLAQLGRAADPVTGAPATGPVFPVNLAGDFGGGGMFLAFGVLAALTRARATGQGAVVDAAMVEGSNALWAMMHGFAAMGQWGAGAGRNMLDGGAPAYDRYRSKDGAWFSVGCIEPQFFAAFVERTGIADRLPGPVGGFNHMDPQYWDELRPLFAEAIGTRTAAELTELFAGVDACVFEILDFPAAQELPHNRARGVFYTDSHGVRHPSPAPRFRPAGSTTTAAVGGGEAGAAGASEGNTTDTRTDEDTSPSTAWDYVVPADAPELGAHNEELSTRLGLDASEFATLRSEGLFG